MLHWQPERWTAAAHAGPHLPHGPCPCQRAAAQPCLQGTTSDWLLLGMKTPAEVLIVTTEWEVCVMIICPSRITLKPPNSFHSSYPGAIQGWSFSFIPRPSKIPSRNRCSINCSIDMFTFPEAKFCLSLAQVSFSLWGSCVAIAWCVTTFYASLLTSYLRPYPLRALNLVENWVTDGNEQYLCT